MTKPIRDKENYFDIYHNCLTYAFNLAIKKIDEQERYSFMGYKNVPPEVFHELNDSVRKLEQAKLYFIKLYEKELREGTNN